MSIDGKTQKPQMGIWVNTAQRQQIDLLAIAVLALCCQFLDSFAMAMDLGGVKGKTLD